MDNSEIEFLRRENERLRKALDEQRQVSITSPSLINNHELISDMCRYAEGLLPKETIKKKWREIIDEKTWNELGSDETLVQAIETEKVRRIRNGQTKREKAQSLIVKTPEILDSIAQDASASPRHRVDAIKTLDGMSDTGPQAVPPADRFIIRIDLSADAKLRSTEPDPKDIITIEATRPAAIADQSEDDWK
jgi:hypothetical protein